jgi:hypothetical protein
VADCTQANFGFPACRKRAVEVDFSGGAVSSNGGVLLLRAADRRLGLSAAAARVLRDPRDPGRCRHSALAQLRQRLYGLALGYEYLNDHGESRHDPALQTAVDRVAPLASAPTLCRFEHWADRVTAVALNQVLIEQFIASFGAPPEEIVLDFDATDVPIHGRQEGRFSMGIMTTTAFCRFTYFAASNCLSPICGRPRSTPPSTVGRSWRYWSDGCARRGRAFVSCCGPTAAFAGRGS